MENEPHKMYYFFENSLRPRSNWEYAKKGEVRFTMRRGASSQTVRSGQLHLLQKGKTERKKRGTITVWQGDEVNSVLIFGENVHPQIGM